MFGWTAAEVVGGKARHQPPGREEELAELMRRVREGEVYTSIESRRVRRDGAVIDVEISAAPIRDTSGEVVSHLALFTDITQRKRQEEELRASRARIVQAGDEARRRLERNLHDGAQQRLVALSLTLRLAQSKIEADPAYAEQALESAREELAAALDELRELARGIHPAVLTDRGLTAAVETLARRSPVPVEVLTPEDRLPIAGRGGRVLRHRRVAHQREQVRARLERRRQGQPRERLRRGRGGRRRRRRRGSMPAAAACAGSSTASSRSPGRWPSRARPAAARA